MSSLIAIYKSLIGDRVQGKKTYLLVIAAIVLVMMGGMEDPTNGTLDFSNLNNADLLKLVLVGMVGAGRSALAK